MIEPIVSTEWLNKNINLPDLIIIDASQNSVMMNSKNTESIRIKRARSFDLKNNFSDKNSSYPNTFPSSEQFQNECRNLRKVVTILPF